MLFQKLVEFRVLQKTLVNDLTTKDIAVAIGIDTSLQGKTLSSTNQFNISQFNE